MQKLKKHLIFKRAFPASFSFILFFLPTKLTKGNNNILHKKPTTPLELRSSGFRSDCSVHSATAAVFKVLGQNHTRHMLQQSWKWIICKFEYFGIHFPSYLILQNQHALRCSRWPTNDWITLGGEQCLPYLICSFVHDHTYRNVYQSFNTWFFKLLKKSTNLTMGIIPTIYQPWSSLEE